MPSQGFFIVALTLSPGAVDLGATVASGGALHKETRVLVLAGNEGDGLTDETAACSNLHVKIGMADGVDSLNVHVSTAVVLQALFTRQR